MVGGINWRTSQWKILNGCNYHPPRSVLEYYRILPYPAKRRGSGRLLEPSLGVQLTVKLCNLYGVPFLVFRSVLAHSSVQRTLSIIIGKIQSTAYLKICRIKHGPHLAQNIHILDTPSNTPNGPNRGQNLVYIISGMHYYHALALLWPAAHAESSWFGMPYPAEFCGPWNQLLLDRLRAVGLVFWTEHSFPECLYCLCALHWYWILCTYSCAKYIVIVILYYRRGNCCQENC